MGSETTTCRSSLSSLLSSSPWRTPSRHRKTWSLNKTSSNWRITMDHTAVTATAVTTRALALLDTAVTATLLDTALQSLLQSLLPSTAVTTRALALLDTAVTATLLDTALQSLLQSLLQSP